MILKVLMAFQRVRNIAHRSLAGFMALWLSGVVFLVCCHMRNANAAETEFCPLAKLGVHCDKVEKAKDTERITTQGNEPGMDCCAFIPAFFDKTRTSENGAQVVFSAPPPSLVRPRLVPIQTRFSPTYSFRSTVLPKSSTFLKNCTFRI